MKIAIMSDIHGYSLAFRAVLDDIEGSGIDRIVVAGDLCEGGPDPAGVVDLLREHDCRCVYGNTDRSLLEQERGFESGSAWTRDQVGPEGLDYLRSLPFEIRINHSHASDDAARDLLIVHANPTDVDRHLSPNASERKVLEIIGDEPANTIVFGHLHVSYVRQIADRTLVDVSAVGNPRDGDLRPRYAIFDDEQTTGIWSYEYRYVDYPLEQTRAQMEASGMPHWKKAYDRLVSAEYNRSI